MAEIVAVNSLDLTIDGAWSLLDPTPLLGEAPHRGEDREAPGETGRVARPRTRGGLDVALEMYVFGLKASDGTSHADKRLGLRDNIRKLRTDLLPPYSGSTSAPITHTFDDAEVASGTCIVNEVKVVGAHDGLKGNVAAVVLDLIVLEGRLTV